MQPHDGESDLEGDLDGGAARMLPVMVPMPLPLPIAPMSDGGRVPQAELRQPPPRVTHPPRFRPRTRASSQERLPVEPEAAARSLGITGPSEAKELGEVCTCPVAPESSMQLRMCTVVPSWCSWCEHAWLPQRGLARQSAFRAACLQQDLTKAPAVVSHRLRAPCTLLLTSMAISAQLADLFGSGLQPSKRQANSMAVRAAASAAIAAAAAAMEAAAAASQKAAHAAHMASKRASMGVEEETPRTRAAADELLRIDLQSALEEAATAKAQAAADIATALERDLVKAMNSNLAVGIEIGHEMSRAGLPPPRKPVRKVKRSAGAATRALKPLDTNTLHNLQSSATSALKSSRGDKSSRGGPKSPTKGHMSSRGGPKSPTKGQRQSVRLAAREGKVEGVEVS